MFQAGGPLTRFKIYAKYLGGQDAIAKRRVEDALSDPGEDDISPPDSGGQN